MSAKLTSRNLEALATLLVEQGIDLSALQTDSGKTPPKGETTKAKPSSDGTATPFLSCWNPTSVGGRKAKKVGQKFVSKTRNGEVEYVHLSKAQVIQIVEDNLKAGRFYAVPSHLAP
jgi:hypothetical protein